MLFKKMFVLMLTMGLSATMFAQSAEKQYFLVDYRTQMPVLGYPVQPNWLAGGKTNWTTEPATPVNWHVWTMSPDQQVKIIFSSLSVLPGNGQIRQIPFLQNPYILPNTLLPNVQKDHNLTNVRLVDARREMKS